MIRQFITVWLCCQMAVILVLCAGHLLPPGPQLAYETRKTRENYDIHLLDVRHRIEYPLTRTAYGERHPAWSPDGETIVFTSNQTGAWELYTMLPTPGTARRQLTTDNNRAMHPTWSPDGQTIAFDSNRDGNNQEIYTLSLLDGRIQRQTRAAGSDEGAVWSPDGRRLAFTSYRDNDMEIYVLALATGQQINLTQNPAFNDWAAGWSPDGTTITFTSTRASIWQIYQAPLTNPSAVRTLTQSERDIAGAVWSPDGTQLVAERYNRAGNRSLYQFAPVRAGARGYGLRRLTLGPADDRFPAWRPMLR
jgi:Tol biopolymer transport system component